LTFNVILSPRVRVFASEDRHEDFGKEVAVTRGTDVSGGAQMMARVQF
jgi:hypothetical protein